MSFSVISLKTDLLITNDVKDLSDNLIILFDFKKNDSSNSSTNSIKIKKLCI